ncbi:hypothetical protein TYRP_000301 [Tyrophagus putrescentiae]|nr:hypothetical protein TYRP_000301 [Tyrophagus putrescentiae]
MVKVLNVIIGDNAINGVHGNVEIANAKLLPCFGIYYHRCAKRICGWVQNDMASWSFGERIAVEEAGISIKILQHATKVNGMLKTEANT